MAGSSKPTGPDLTQGIPESDIQDGSMLAGRVGDEAVLVARGGDTFYAVGGTCTHYGAPLADGLMVGKTVRCPWHHARFSLETGEAVGAPALDHVTAWKVERKDGKVFVREKVERPIPSRTPKGAPASVVILGNGAAGQAAAEMLRRRGYAGPVTLIEADPHEPCDRPNLSKDYLAGNAKPEWIPLRDADFFAKHDLTRVRARATAIDPGEGTVTLADGKAIAFDRLLVATGARPRSLPVPVADGAPLHYLRTLGDSDAIIAAATKARRAVVIGASFIGLEVAASLRARGVEVHVAAPEDLPLGRIMGEAIGRFVQQAHEDQGVRFHLGVQVEEVTATGVRLKGGETLAADLVVAGVGVVPNDDLAKAAGLRTDNGIVVDPRLRTSAPNIWAAGDVARYPDPRTGDLVRIEHWVHAERMGQHAARTMLGDEAPFTDPPFFWSQHYDAVIAYVGHAAGFDAVEVDGDPAEKDCAVRYLKGGKAMALATIFRDEESLQFEAAIATSPT